MQKDCKVCGDKTNNLFNINLSAEPICEKCVVSIIKQQLEWLIDNSQPKKKKK